MSPSPVLQLSNIRKQYHGLRPLRVRALSLGAGERVALAGLDAAAAEVLVNLVTGASLPDEGNVLVFGRSTHRIADGDEWLASLDRFGIVSPRAVLLESATVLQNLAMPFTLSIDPVPSDVAARVASLASEAGIPHERLEQAVAQLPMELRVRAHVARAIALDPVLLILEHPTAGALPAERRSFGRTVAALTDARQLATLIISEDREFSASAAQVRYTLEPATGELKPIRKRIFGL